MSKTMVLVIAAASLVGCAAPADESDAESTTGAQTAAAPAGPCSYESRSGISTADDTHTSRGKKYTDNDSADHATELNAHDDTENSARWDEAYGIASKKDTDWFRFHVADSSSSTSKLLKPSVRIMKGGSNFKMCAFTTRSAQCEVGTKAAKVDGMNGCCATDGSGVRLDIETPLVNDSTDIFVRVEALGDSCEHYTLAYNAASFE